MRTTLAKIMIAAAVGCGGKRAADPEPQPQASPPVVKFALVLPDSLVVHAEETVVVALVAVGASGPISFTAEGLPPYAVVQDNTIRATPHRGDTPGETTVTVTATDGSRSDSGHFVLSLANASPAWSGTPQVVYRTPRPSGYQLAPSYPLESSDAPLVLLTRAIIDAAATDPDGDPVELLVEFRAAGDPMTGVPTGRSGLTPPLRVELPVLELDRHYALDVWLRDSHGSDSTHVRRADVSRQNTPPQPCDLSLLSGVGNYQFFPTSTTLVLHGTITLTDSFCDVDGDPVQLLAEVQPQGVPLTGTPNHVEEQSYAWFPMADGRIDMALPELEVGKHYQVAFWFRDVYGAESPRWVQNDFMRDQ
jgi:hypothetical protein